MPFNLHDIIRTISIVDKLNFEFDLKTEVADNMKNNIKMAQNFIGSFLQTEKCPLNAYDTVDFLNEGIINNCSCEICRARSNDYRNYVDKIGFRLTV